MIIYGKRVEFTHLRYFFTKKKDLYFGGVNYKDLKKFGISEHDIKPYLPIHKNDYNKEIKKFSPAIFFKSRSSN